MSIAKRESLYMYTTIHAISLNVVWMWLSLAVYVGNRTYQKYAILVSSSKVFLCHFSTHVFFFSIRQVSLYQFNLIYSIFLFASCNIHTHTQSDKVWLQTSLYLMVTTPLNILFLLDVNFHKSTIGFYFFLISSMLAKFSEN